MKVTISKHEDVSTQNWYGTTLDSQMHFHGSFNTVDKSIRNKYFDTGHNGGSYSLNFDSKNLDEILNVLNISEPDTLYTLDHTEENGMRNTHDIDKEKYLAYDVSNHRDYYTDYLAPYFKKMM